MGKTTYQTSIPRLKNFSVTAAHIPRVQSSNVRGSVLWPTRSDWFVRLTFWISSPRWPRMTIWRNFTVVWFLPLYLSLSLYLYLYLSIYLSIYLPIYLSLYLYLSCYHISILYRLVTHSHRWIYATVHMCVHRCVTRKPPLSVNRQPIRICRPNIERGNQSEARRSTI